MREKYFPPTYGAKQFHCVRCGVFASQDWRELNRRDPYRSPEYHKTEFKATQCMHCYEFSYWFREKIVDPPSSTAEPPHGDLPEVCREDYLEALEIVDRSPRGAAALLRLVVQKLMIELGESGANINADIGSLVAKGLPPVIQQALDFARVVGNNAVHPGEINIQDNPEIAHQLFRMVNFIVDERISRPRQIAALYDSLPEGARRAIEKRDIS